MPKLKEDSKLLFETMQNNTFSKKELEWVSIFYLSSLILLASQPGELVGDDHIELSCPFNDRLPLLGRDVVSNLSTVSPEKSG